MNHHSLLRTARISALLAGAAFVAGTLGCGKTEQPQPAAHTLGQFCSPLLDYFATDLKVARVQLIGVDENAPLTTATTTGTCTFSGNVATVNGGAWINPLSEGQKLADSPQWFEDRGYVPLPGHGADLWLDDSRTIKQSIQKRGTVNLITQVGAWQGHLQIADNVGPLAITDEQIGKAADALISATKAASQ